MLKNYILTGIRALMRHRYFAVLNIFGLAVGLAAGVLILQYAAHELSYDQFHANKERIYRIDHTFLKNGAVDFQSAKTYPKVGPAMSSDFPEVEDYCRFMRKFRGGVVRSGDVNFREENLVYADTGFFKVFSFPWIEGDQSTALRDVHTAIVEEGMARKYFGSESPIGKRISVGSMDGMEEFEIRGVFRCPDNSHIKFDFVFSYSSLVSLWGESAANSWNWYDFQTYVLLKPGSDAAALSAKLPAFVDKYGGERLGSKRVQLSLRPVTDIHLDSHLMMEASANGDRGTVYFLMILGAAVLAIAWINFINLSAARAMERAKEVGIRKVAGSSRWQLALQFIVEAFVINVGAVVLSLVIIYLALPMFNDLTGKEFTAGMFLEFSFYSKVIVLAVVGSFVSGAYPAAVLSSYEPIKVLKGALKYSMKGMLLRKGLVVVQFAASVMLIAGTIVIYNQMSYLQTMETGINIENTLIVKTPDVITDRRAYDRSLDLYKQEMSNDNRINQAAITSEIPGRRVSWYAGGRMIGSDQDEPSIILFMTTMDDEYFDAYKIDLVAGRSYVKGIEEDSLNVVINEKAAELFGFKNAEEALQQRIRLLGDTMTIIGVVENYFQESPKEDFKPSAYLLTHQERSFFTFRFQAGSENDLIENARTSFAKIFPGLPFEYFFLSDFYEAQYLQDQNFMKSFLVFAAIAIIIASLGLFGLSSYLIVQRTKEVGVRKVLGSTSGSIFFLFLKEFLVLIAVSNVIAVPIVYVFMNEWLSEFTRRILIGPEVFVITVLGTSFLALVTISYHAVNASRLNPARALKHE